MNPQESTVIRPYRAADRAAVRHICCETADRGLPVESIFADRERGRCGWLCCAWAAWLLSGIGRAVAGEPSEPFAPVDLKAGDRILVLAPHPDDEVIGCGGVIARATGMKLPVRVVFLTYGDDNEWAFAIYRKHPVLEPAALRRMGLMRHDEALLADAALGLGTNDLTFLGYPDSGTLRIWDEHWAGNRPFESLLTRAREVPYANAYRPGAPYKGEEIVKDLSAILREFAPTKVLVSHPADHNVDHRALYLFTSVALWNLEAEIRPAVYPYLVHFPRWPRPRGFFPDATIAPPALLLRQMPWQAFDLTRTEVSRKRFAIEKHRTQYTYASGYLLSFVRNRELFGDFPRVWLSPAPGQAHDLEAGRGESVTQPAREEDLTDAEREAFVGVERRTVQWDGKDLVLSMEFSRPLAETVGASLEVFGYRRDRPFEQMPKLRVRLGPLAYEVADRDRRLPLDTVAVERHSRAVTVRVPAGALGQPERILTSIRTYLGEFPLDWVSWRILETGSAAPAAR